MPSHSQPSPEILLLSVLYAILFGAGGFANLNFIRSIASLKVTNDIVPSSVEIIAYVQIYHYLYGLCLVDLLYISFLPLKVTEMVTQNWIFGQVLCKVSFILDGLNYVFTPFLLTLICFDRYLVICKQTHQGSRMRSSRFAIRAIVLALFVALVCQGPHIYSASVAKFGEEDTHQKCVVKDDKFQRNLSTGLLFCFGYCIPTIWIVFLNISIAKATVYERIHGPKLIIQSLFSMSYGAYQRKKRRRRVTRSVFLLVFVFVGCRTTFWLYKCLCYFEGSQYSPHMQITKWLCQYSGRQSSELILYINSTLNAICYTIIKNRMLSRQHGELKCIVDEHERGQNLNESENLATLIPLVTSNKSNRQLGRSKSLRYPHKPNANYNTLNVEVELRLRSESTEGRSLSQFSSSVDIDVTYSPNISHRDLQSSERAGDSSVEQMSELEPKTSTCSTGEIQLNDFQRSSSFYRRSTDSIVNDTRVHSGHLLPPRIARRKSSDLRQEHPNFEETTTQYHETDRLRRGSSMYVRQWTPNSKRM